MALCAGGKLRSLGNSKHELMGYGFWCPGCDGMHAVPTEACEPMRWGFNGNVEKPTFTPSILVHEVPGHSPRCHSFVTDGRIQFLGDCTHKLAGQTVEIPQWPDDHMAFEDNHAT